MKMHLDFFPSATTSSSIARIDTAWPHQTKVQWPPIKFDAFTTLNFSVQDREVRVTFEKRHITP